MNDSINHPRHYTASPAECSNCGKSIECIDVTEHFDFCLGNAIKYIWRAGKKGSEIEDLEKSVWYLNRKINSLTASQK